MAAELLHPEVMVSSRHFHQFPVRGESGSLAIFQHQDAVGAADDRQAVRNDQHRPAARNGIQIVLDDFFALRVQRAGRFVENQDRRIGQQRPGDRQPLFLLEAFSSR